MIRVARTWLSLTVELVEGGGYRYWPRPGRVFALARSHTFAELATAIDVAFGRWDLAHAWRFELPRGFSVVPATAQGLGAEATSLPESSRLSRLALGDAFVYELGDRSPWVHVCRVGATRIDPLEELGDSPPEPTAYDGWGVLPDQYLRRFEGDDGTTPLPPDPRNRDLPPLRPGWGRPAGRPTAARAESESASPPASAG